MRWIVACTVVMLNISCATPANRRDLYRPVPEHQPRVSTTTVTTRTVEPAERPRTRPSLLPARPPITPEEEPVLPPP